MYDVAIIGCGPAGMAAALYLLRAGKTVVIFEYEAPGGQLAKSPLIENYPGFNGSGGDLADLMFDQIEDFHSQVEFVSDEILEVEKDGDQFNLFTPDASAYSATYVIVATGEKHKQLPGIAPQSHVHYCETCDGMLYRGKDVAVIGDGNSALQYALSLANYCSSVTICTMFDHFFGEQKLVDRLMQSDIKWIKNVLVTNIEESSKLRRRLVFNDNTTVVVDGVFVAIGQVPVVPVLPAEVELKDGFIKVHSDQSTSLTNIYAVGDCTYKDIKQVTLAVAEGTTAAMNIIKK